MEHHHELHQEGRSGHLFGLLVQESKNFGLVVGDEAQMGSEECLASLDQEEMSVRIRMPNISRAEIRGVGSPSSVPDSNGTC